MPRNQKIVVEEHERGVFTPVQELLLFHREAAQHFLCFVLLLEPAFLCENEGVFVRTQRYKVFVTEFLDVLNQQLIRFLNKHNIGHRLAHSLLELIKFFTFVEKGLREKRSVLFEINLRVAVDCVVQIEDFEDSKEKSMESEHVKCQSLLYLLLTKFRACGLFLPRVLVVPQLSEPFGCDELP
jgi:hypothetical protein